MTELSLIAVAIAIIGGYFLGSIPFGLVLTKASGLGDIRDIGSGNIGATNVLRTGNKGLALATLLLDAGKAALALIVFGQFYGPIAGLLAGGAAFFGHCFPVWLGFKGGKGVATFVGLGFAANLLVGLGIGVTWLAMAFLFRYSSLSALVAALVAPFAAYFVGGPVMAAVFGLLAAVLIYRHRENIERLRAGTESKIGAKKDAPSA